MPLNGLRPFLQGATVVILRRIRCINALKRASSISTEKEKIEGLSVICFNALKRAYSISTFKHFDDLDLAQKCQCP